MNKKNKQKEPGEYTIISKPYKIRGKKINKKCSLCQVNLEHVWIRTNSLQSKKRYFWEHICTRCPQCGLKYNVSDILL